MHDCLPHLLHIFIRSLVVVMRDRVRHKRIAVCRPRGGRYLVRSPGIQDVWQLYVLGQGSVCNRGAVEAKIPLLTGEFDAFITLLRAPRVPAQRKRLFSRLLRGILLSCILYTEYKMFGYVSSSTLWWKRYSLEFVFGGRGVRSVGVLCRQTKVNNPMVVATVLD